MNIRSLFLQISLVLLLMLASCAPQPGVLDIQIAPATQASKDAAGLEEIQPVAIAFLSGISEDYRMFFEYQDTTCAPLKDAGDGPYCYAGEQPGSAVKVFPIGGAERQFLRPEEIGQIFGWYVEDLYAVFRPIMDAEAKDYWPAGEYGLLFRREERGESIPFVAIVADGRLVRLDVYPGLTPEEVLGRVPIKNIVLAASEAKAWGSTLKSLQVVSQESVGGDQGWRAQTMIALPKQGGDRYYRWMSVLNWDGSVYWPVVNEWAPFAAGYTAPLPFYWSPRSPVLYWTNTLTPDGCVVFSNATDLHRLDLATGVTTRLLEPVGQWLALSPDETRVAAVGQGGLTLYNLATGDKRSAPLPEGQAGQIVWSPDGESLVLTVADTPCGDPERETYSVLRVDQVTMQVTTLLDHDPRRLASLEWLPVGSVLLADKDGNPWQMDPQTAEVWQETGPAEEQAKTTSIYGWVKTASDTLLGGVTVRLGSGACPSTGLAESVTITTDISFSFTGLPSGAYCVSIDPSEPANQGMLPPGAWVQPVHTDGLVQTTVVLAEGESRFNTDFVWMPATP